MDPIASELSRSSGSELGYREKGRQRTQVSASGTRSRRRRDAQFETGAWCDMFIAWAADKAGVSEYVGMFAWTPSHARWFQDTRARGRNAGAGGPGVLRLGGSKKISKIDHVGIVERVEGDRIHTIEGNVDKVWLKRKVTRREQGGRVRPAAQGEGEPGPEPPDLRAGARGRLRPQGEPASRCSARRSRRCRWWRC